MNALIVLFSALALSASTVDASAVVSTRVQFKSQAQFPAADNICIAAPNPAAGSHLTSAHCGPASTLFNITGVQTRLVISAAPDLCVTSRNNYSLELQTCATCDDYCTWNIPSLWSNALISAPSVRFLFGSCLPNTAYEGSRMFLENCSGGSYLWQPQPL